jgi:hypothetical protein
MDEEQGFTVRDHRTGSPDDKAEPAPRPSESGLHRAPEHTRHETIPAPEMDFSTFVISLASTAQMSLGAVPHPETNEISVNLQAAKQMIDIIALLQAKTNGNLSEQEATLLEQVLYTLRIHYVRTSEGQKKSGE